MAMNVQSTLSAYGNYPNGYHAGKAKEKKETKGLQNTAKPVVSRGEKKLSKSAQNLLQVLRSSRLDMDFMVADFDKGDNAKEMLAQSDKEFTVIFSSEELEKMASNEKYYAEKMHSIDGAIRMSEEINAKYGFERAFGRTEGAAGNAAVTKFGILFDSDGLVTLFAELDKSSAKQKTTVQASTWDELLERIREINGDTMKPDTESVGNRFDFTV